jgi:hypothetical protein
MRLKTGATVAKAAAARFVPDSSDDGLPLPVCLNKQISTTYDLPSYHKPQTVLVSCACCLCHGVRACVCAACSMRSKCSVRGVLFPVLGGGLQRVLRPRRANGKSADAGGIEGKHGGGSDCVGLPNFSFFPLGNTPSAAPGLTYVSATWHTFCKARGTRLRKINHRA